ncbi:MAG: putative toxin-antitoxin system toxin component, PIN family [Terracidiphilus sp.]|jgi:putative PIN family toxin of toxin-antitoxin system
MTRRIVLDTNIYVSALLYRGKPKQVLDVALSANCRLLISTPLKLELERVLRDKFRFTPRELAANAGSLWSNAEWIAPRSRLDLCLDESDNRVLECALEGKARFVVTGDRHLLNLPPI